MILQALVNYYEQLEKQGKIAKPGWISVGVSFAVCISESGRLEQIISVKTEQQRGKKTVVAPQNMEVPAQAKRSSGVAANFLCDNAAYLLGIDAKGNPERTIKCFTESSELHKKLLSEVNSETARAILAFFSSWQPEQACENPALAEVWDELFNGGNLVFRVNGRYAHKDSAIQAAWQQYYHAKGDGNDMVCCITGKNGPIARIHPSIKGVDGTQATGASIVSFNKPSFCSFGRDQGLNAPTSEYAAYAYTSALNHLLSNRNRVYKLGNTTVVCWAENAIDAYQALFDCILSDNSSNYSEDEINGMTKSLLNGALIEFNEQLIDPSQPFYILGLSPNSARVSIRFFMRNTFGAFLKNIDDHQQRLKIIRPSWEKSNTLSLWRLLNETVNQKSRDKSPSPELAGEMLSAVLNNTPYPATMLNAVTLRIRAESDITYGRAAAIKAYYLKKPNKDVPKEVLTVSLNKESTNIPYLLGRLFSVYEQIQQEANPGINATIKDKYFNSASGNPAVIFPILGNLAQKHLRVIRRDRTGLAINLEKQIGEITNKIGDSFPARLNLPQQGSFQLGYYHQNAERYIKKEDK